MTSSQPAIRLRDMSQADVEAVLSMEQQVHSHPWTRGMFSDSLANGYICKVCEDAGGIVGYAILMPALDEAHLLDIGIARVYQRRGLGGKLLCDILALAREAKFRRIILEVRRSNIAANALYRKTGFSEIGVRRGYYPVDNGQAENNGQPGNNGKEDALVMEYQLK